ESENEELRNQMKRRSQLELEEEKYRDEIDEKNKEKLRRNALELAELKSTCEELNSTNEDYRRKISQLENDKLILQSVELSDVNLGELESENHRFSKRVNEAKVRIDSLETEKLNLEEEMKKMFEESTELARELDGVRGRLEEMER
ncbi:hypothetical protein PMAYCL1PPCAC_25916, partial [Pristionchus mayeri]